MDSKTIIVRGEYVVDPGVSLDFVNHAAFDLRGAGALVENHGKLTVEYDKGSAVAGMKFEGGTFINAANGSFKMTATGTTAAFGSINGELAAFENHGLWEVSGAGSFVLGLNLVTGGAFTNTGAFEAHCDAGSATAVAIQQCPTYVNSGLIHADGETFAGGIGINQIQTGAVSIDNSGMIEAFGGSDLINTAAIGLSGSEDTTTSVEITNTGTIRSNGYAILQYDSDAPYTPLVEIVHNPGKLLGDVFLGTGTDHLDNGGHITGDVNLGGDDDVFDGAAGKVKGEVSGGGGSDTLIGGKGGDVLHGDSDLSDIQPGAGDQISGGKGADQLFGEDGNDTLAGGAGADTLAGGAGEDSFAFANLKEMGGAPDTIADLENTDFIDLSHIDADVTQDGDQAFHLVASFTGHAGELVLSQPDGPGGTLVQVDVDGDGEADGEIQLSGDHTDFTNFVL